MEDTIAAIATSSGIASIGIIRISGKETFNIIKKIFKTNKKLVIEPNTIKYGYIQYEGKKIDEVLVSFFVKPHSFTKEDVCEINCHGGIAVVKKILEVVLENGARLAEPGEFTKRAFLNGRIDLSQAEAIIEVINSKTDRMLKESEKQLNGTLANDINDIEKELLDIISDVEANIDYPEYDIEETTNKEIEKKLNIIKEKLNKLIGTFNTGKILREGINIALVGKPNVGKSSILNRLLREERAIVTDIKGTTRDTIEEYINIKGIMVKIFDTAGIRETEDIIERKGVDKSIELIEKADIILGIFDSSNNMDEEDKYILEKIKDKNSIIVFNKIDIKSNNNFSIEINKDKIIEISAKEDIGIENLQDKIYELCNIDDNIKDNETIITNTRHRNILEKAVKNIDECLIEINNNIPIDMLSIKITDTLNILGEITGKTVTEEIINTIFSKFCLGK